jgi:hypothetical protein
MKAPRTPRSEQLASLRIGTLTVRVSNDTADATLPPGGRLLERRERVVSPRPLSRVIGDGSKTALEPSRAASAMSTRTAIGKPR